MYCSISLKVYLTLIILAVTWPSLHALPAPGKQEPLPGRTGEFVEGQNIMGNIGDDWMPEHMRHLQDSQKKYPSHAQPFPYDPWGQATRGDRFIGIPNPGPHPVSNEAQVRDEKTWASQMNPNWRDETTVRMLPHYESGGKLSIPEQERADKYNEDAKKKWLAEDPRRKPENFPTKTHGYHGPKMPDGSYRTENVLASNVQKVAGEIKEKGGQPTIQLRPNPGWLSLDPKQQRAHEAPARFNSETRKPIEKGPIEEGKKPARQPQTDGPSVDKGTKSPSADAPPASSDSNPAGRPRREGANYESVIPIRSSKSNTEPKPKNTKVDDPKGYVFPEKPHPSEKYKLDKNGKPNKVAISPPKESTSLSRQPPRPQNREAWEKQKEQAKKAKQEEEAKKAKQPKPATKKVTQEAPARVQGNKDHNAAPSQSEVDKWKAEHAAKGQPSKPTTKKVTQEAPARIQGNKDHSGAPRKSEVDRWKAEHAAKKQPQPASKKVTQEAPARVQGNKDHSAAPSKSEVDKWKAEHAAEAKAKAKEAAGAPSPPSSPKKQSSSSSGRGSPTPPKSSSTGSSNNQYKGPTTRSKSKGIGGKKKGKRALLLEAALMRMMRKRMAMPWTDE